MPDLQIDNDFIIFIHNGRPIRETPLAMCDTYEKILDLAYSLSEKTWMDLTTLRQFIKIALKHNNLKHPGSPKSIPKE